MDYSLYKARKPRMTKFGQGVGVRAHYPTVSIQVHVEYGAHKLQQSEDYRTEFK